MFVIASLQYGKVVSIGSTIFSSTYSLVIQKKKSIQYAYIFTLKNRSVFFLFERNMLR